MNLLLPLLGLFVGALSGGLGGALIGASAGAAFAATREQRKQLERQNKELARLQLTVQSLVGMRGQAGGTQAPQAAVDETGVAAQASSEAATGEPTASANPTGPATSHVRDFAKSAFREESQPDALQPTEGDPWPELGPPASGRRVETPQARLALENVSRGLSKAVREFFTGGNTVVRVGLLVLMVGVVLLLKYAADHDMFPIEARMASAALLGLALVAIGFRQRETRPGFSTTLQGGGVAIMYLVVFFSMRVYELLPIPMGFALLASLAVFSGVMAVVQNSLALIVIGIIGGFLAPILASTGAGNHVALFSYYLLLNVLIMVVAWFKSWRPLNLLGFGFTFGVGTLWGVLKYTPENFASTEPFLIAFFLLYVAIVVIFAWRRPAELRGFVDGSLTFGTPLAFLGLQYEMVKDMPFGMAYSAAGIGIVYAVAASFLFRRAPQAMRNLVEAFLALAIGFGTLAIPYGFSNQSLTGATWAVEGFGLYWLGVRQNRWLSRLSGFALQLMAGVALFVSIAVRGYPSDAMAVLNTQFLGSLLLAFSGLGVACLAARNQDKLHKSEKLANLLIPWAMVWWYTACLREVMQHVDAELRSACILFIVVGTSILLEHLGKRLQWLGGRLPALLPIPAMLLLLGFAYRFDWIALNPIVTGARATKSFEPALQTNPMAFWGWLAWPVAVLGTYSILFRLGRDAMRLAQPFHAALLWIVSMLVALTLAHFVRGIEGLGGAWAAATLGVGLMLVLGVARQLRSRISDLDLRDFYQRYASGGLALGIALWLLRTSTLSSGDAAPLPYLPLLNPIDLGCGLALLSCLLWSRGLKLKLGPQLAILLFLWFNGILARTVHQYDDTAFTTRALWDSVPMQVSVSVSWALIGLGTIGWATRAKLRPIWFGGGGLLAVVVAKLFLVDLKHLSSVAKIGTFLVVGLLLLVVGYFSPVPPTETKSTSASEHDQNPS